MDDTEPTFVVEPAIMRARGQIKWTFHEPDVIPLWVAEMDYGTAPEVLDAVRAAVERQELGYALPDTVSGLDVATAAFLQDSYAWSVRAEHVRGIPEVVSAIVHAVDALTPPGSAVVVPTPAYPPFLVVPPSTGRDVVQMPMAVDAGRRVLDLDAVDSEFAAGARSLVLPNPHNPLGRSFDADELVALAEVADRHGARVMSDELHAPMTYPGTSHVPFASVSDEAARTAVTFVSASKAWNVPGLKCAQVVFGSDDDAAAWDGLSPYVTGIPSPLGVHATIAAYRDGGRWLADVVRRLDENRRLLATLLEAHLPGVTCTQPEATYLAWLDFSALGLEQDPAAFFLEHARVALSPGPDFGTAGVAGARLNFATSPELLTVALTAMGGALNAWP